jgi:hypothetical protein
VAYIKTIWSKIELEVYCLEDKRMKIKKLLPTQSPLAWIITAGVVAVTASPTVRKKVRQFAVKGTAAVLELTDQLKKKWAKSTEQEKFHFDFTGWQSPAVAKPEGTATSGGLSAVSTGIQPDGSTTHTEKFTEKDEAKNDQPEPENGSITNDIKDPE